uniref:Uncharacterized protein n=1 Tax=mine drainage metagenome TaxID=410659 RepID=E6QWK9_9ZZZZ
MPHSINHDQLRFLEQRFKALIDAVPSDVASLSELARNCEARGAIDEARKLYERIGIACGSWLDFRKPFNDLHTSSSNPEQTTNGVSHVFFRRLHGVPQRRHHNRIYRGAHSTSRGYSRPV